MKVIKVKSYEPGEQRGFAMGKRGLKAFPMTIRQWKAKNQHRHNGGVSALNKGVVYWRQLPWEGGKRG